MHQRTEEEIMQNWKVDSDKPIVSISNITYNHEKFIAEALDGFLMQETNFAFEVLVHDDCSTDNTANIIREYEKKYPNIIKPIYQKENQFSKGITFISATFNFPRAKGKYIALCEGDDYWTDPLKLQKQMDFLEENDEYVCCIHDSEVIDEEGSVVAHTHLGRGARDYSEMELLSVRGAITPLVFMFRNIRSIAEFSDELKEVPFGDRILWHLMGFHGKVKFLRNIKNARYRKHACGMWNGMDRYKQFEKMVLSRQIIRKNLLKNHISTTMIDLDNKNYILNYMRSALSVKDINLYKKIILKLFKDKDYSFLYLVDLVVKSFTQPVRRKIMKVVGKI